MSKLVDRLHRTSEGSVQPLGFSVAAPERIPALILVARLSNPTKEIVSGATTSGAEFLLVSGGPRGGLPKTLPPAGIDTSPWGVQIGSLTEDQRDTLKKAGCDFAMVSVEETPVRLMSDEDVGFVASVSTALDDRHLRAIDELPFDAIVVDAEPAADLTLKLLLDYTVVSSRIGHHLLARASLDWGAGEVEQLRDLGFNGLLVDVDSAADIKKLQALRDAILALPARSRRKDEKPRASVPYLGAGGEEEHQHEHEEPDEDDE